LKIPTSLPGGKYGRWAVIGLFIYVAWKFLKPGTANASTTDSQAVGGGGKVITLAPHEPVYSANPGFTHTAPIILSGSPYFDESAPELRPIISGTF
jgi:hypothetical protein